MAWCMPICKSVAAERPAPPLWTLAAGALLALLTVVAVSVTPFSAEKLDPHYFHIARLQVADQPVVAVIGTSLIRHALPFDDQLNRLPDAAPYHVVRITKASATAANFVSLLPHLLDARVNTVVFQAEPLVLCFGSCNTWYARENGVIDTLEGGLDRFRHAVTALRFLLAGGGENFGEAGLFLEGAKGAPDVDLNIKPCVAGGSLPDAYAGFFAQARARGMRVILVSLGRAPSARAALGADFQNHYEQAVAALAARYGLEVWRFPEQPAAHFRDRAHLNSKGRGVFTRWFLYKLGGAS